jgi:glutamate carboxypeptidase
MGHASAAIDQAEALRWLDAQAARLLALLTELASINSGSFNPDGVSRVCAIIRREFQTLGASIEMIEHPPVARPGDDGDGTATQYLSIGPTLLARMRPNAPEQILLGIHSDTVYGPDHPFQLVEQIDANRLRGPGVCDAKGGLVVMLAALATLERSGVADRIGWTAFVNPDEEIGSPASGPILAGKAAKCLAGFIFEPALPDGNLVGWRKGSSNFQVNITGRAAHAGRDIEKGRNAIDAAADLIVALRAINDAANGVTINIASLRGGGPLNVVPDRAVFRFNLRADSADAQEKAIAQARQFVESLSHREGFAAELQTMSHCPPKSLDAASRLLLEHAADCGRRLGLSLTWRGSGGVSDGNRLAAAGLPTIDTLGVRGDHIHGSNEFMYMDSLVERSRLAAMLIMRLAGGELAWPAPTPRKG